MNYLTKERIHKVTLFLATMLFLSVVSYYLFRVAVTNMQLLNHLYALMIDEVHDNALITSIISISSWNDFYYLFYDNNTQPYHGMVTLYLPALLAILPKYFFGLPGQVYTLRMASAFFMLASYWIFARTFLRSQYLRYIVCLFFIALPFSDMFAVWPRCESYMFFFLAVFLYLQKKHHFQSARAFFFLGLAFISRESVLTLIPFFYLIYFFRIGAGTERLKGVLWFFLGTVLAQPHLLNPKYLSTWLSQKWFQVFDDTGVIESIDFSHWANKHVPWYTYHQGLLWFFAGLAVLLALFAIYSKLATVRGFKEKIQSLKNESWMLCQVTLVLISLITLLGIMSFVQIGWTPWYLQQHILLMALGAFAITEEIISNRSSFWPKVLLGILLILCAFFATLRLEYFSWSKITYYALSKMAKRESEQTFLNKVTLLNQIKQTLNELNLDENRKYEVRQTTEQFTIPDYKHFKFFQHPEFWAFRNLREPLDFIVASPQNYKPKLTEPPINDGEREWWEENIKQYSLNVIPKHGGKCIGPNCFDAIPIKNGYMLFYRQKVMKK